ncbi:MAG TPA: outer membrane lipoprotein LolB [Wenzhouxiangellaceae bacterium]|nr:outer membrane lipoprotein LolB [Wenzhouxiangellaceae bacterium]
MQVRAAAWVALSLALLTSGCALREPRPEGAWLAERQVWFSEHPQWSVRGRLGLSDGKRGGSLSMTWTADGSNHVVLLRTVAGGRQWRLEMTPAGSTLTGSDIGRLRGPDPDQLVERAVGWPIPVRWMSEWLRGLPAPAGARTRYAEDGVLQALAWAGWQLDFDRWNQLGGDGVLLPARVTAENPPYRVRAALSGWRFEPAGAPASL